MTDDLREALHTAIECGDHPDEIAELKRELRETREALDAYRRDHDTLYGLTKTLRARREQDESDRANHDLYSL